MSRRNKRQSKADILAGIEARRIETAQARQEAQRLEATGAEAKVVEEKDEKGRTRVVVRARRIDVFQLLRERDAIPQESFDAIRSYEADVSTAMGWNTPERRPDYIRGSQEGAPGQNVSQPMIEASDRLAWVEFMLTTRDRRLLSALLHENDGSLTRWRETVERITGEKRDPAAVVRYMAANVRDVRDRYAPGWRRVAA